MALRVAINGFGRIGRLVLRAAMEAGRKDIEFVAINDLGSAEANAHLLKHDSVHGRYPGKVEAMETAIKVDGHETRVLSEREPAKLPWGDLGIDVVMECTGRFNKRDAASAAANAGPRSRAARPGHRCRCRCRRESSIVGHILRRADCPRLRGP